MKNIKNIDKIISYIGSKVKLYDFLKNTILENHEDSRKINFFDLFAGTNAVSNLVSNNKKWNIITNDMHKYSYTLSYFLDFNNLKIRDKKRLVSILESLNNLKLIEGDIFNEFSINGNPKSIDSSKKDELFHNQPINSRMFFSEIVGKKIDTIKNEIYRLYKNNEISDIDKEILTIFLINYADKNANTASVYGSYLKNNKQNIEKPFLDENLLNNLRYLNRPIKNRLRHENKDIISVLKKLKSENIYKKEKNIIYLDPPYNTRSYEGNYHILEFIADYSFDYNKIKYNSKTGQPKSTFENLFRSKSGTKKIFKEMIELSLNISNNLYISYSTDGLITEKEINEFYSELKKTYPNLLLKTYKKDYKRFKSANKHDKDMKIRKNKLDNIKNKTKSDLEEIKKINEEIENAKKKHKINEVNDLEEIIWHFQVADEKYKIKKLKTPKHKIVENKELYNLIKNNDSYEKLSNMTKDELIYIILKQKEKNQFYKKNDKTLIIGEKRKEKKEILDRKNGKIIFNNSNYEEMQVIKNDLISPISLKIPDNNLFKWIGGKKWLKNNIAYITKNINHENSDIYIEPFVGGLGSFKAILPYLIKNSYKKIILNDLNPLIIETFKSIKNNPEELIKEYEKISLNYEKLFNNLKIECRKYNKEKKVYELTFSSIQELDKTKDKEVLKDLLLNQKNYYNKIRTHFNKNKENINIERVSEFLFLMTYSFNGIYRENSRGNMNSPFNWNNKFDDLNKKIELIKEYNVFFNSLNIIFENLDVFALLKKYNYKRTFIYLDPPYLNEIENSENKYTKSSFRKEEQLELLKVSLNYNTILYSNHFQKDLIDILNINNFKIFKALRKNIMTSKAENRGLDKAEVLALKEIK